MKRRPIKTRKHYILFAADSPFKAKKEINRKRRAKKGYRKHKNNITL